MEGRLPNWEWIRFFVLGVRSWSGKSARQPFSVRSHAAINRRSKIAPPSAAPLPEMIFIFPDGLGKTEV